MGLGFGICCGSGGLNAICSFASGQRLNVRTGSGSDRVDITLINGRFATQSTGSGSDRGPTSL